VPSPELQTVLQLLRSNPPIPEGVPFDEMRAGMEATTGTFPLPEGLQSEPVDAGGVPAEWISMPESSPDRTLLYLHGGGYCIGSINTHRGMVGEIARASGCRALLIDYRLAPEHRFPAALDDALAAWRFLLDQGCEPSRASIAGDSAGGGLTVATLVAARDAGHPLPGAAACLSPWVDLEGTGESMDSKADADPMVQRDGLLRMARAYLGEAAAHAPLASPLHADLAGLPPMLVQVGTSETLLDDSTRLAERARSEGVDVSLEIWEEMIHVFQAFGAMLPEAREAVAQIGEFLRKRTS
jgi:acetyl esterase/lipase